MNMIIQSPHFTADKKLLQLIERKMKKLGQYYDRIVELHVKLKLENSGQVRDKIVEVKIMVPGDMLHARGSKKTFESAIDEALTVSKRQLIRFKERVKSF